MKKYVSYILLCLCAHLHFTEVTGNELLLVHWEKQREGPPSRRGHNDVTQSAVFWDICYVDNPDRCFSSKKQKIWHNSFHSLWKFLDKHSILKSPSILLKTHILIQWVWSKSPSVYNVNKFPGDDDIAVLWTILWVTKKRLPKLKWNLQFTELK